MDLRDALGGISQERQNGGPFIGAQWPRGDRRMLGNLGGPLRQTQGESLEWRRQRLIISYSLEKRENKQHTTSYLLQEYTIPPHGMTGMRKPDYRQGKVNTFDRKKYLNLSESGGGVAGGGGGVGYSQGPGCP